MRKKENLVLRKAGRKYMIADSRKGAASDVYTLNDSSAWLWENIGDGEFSTEEVVDILCEAYDVDRGTATADVTELLEGWKKIGLIR